MPEPAAAAAAAEPARDASFYPPLAFSFSVSFDAEGSDVDASFREVGGIGSEMETEAVREGGENRFVHQLPKVVKAQRLSLQRGIAPLDSTLVQWCRDTLESDWMQTIETKLVHVHLLDAKHVPVRSWSFEGAYPVRWSVEPFQSMRNEVAVERIELCYRAVKREK